MINQISTTGTRATTLKRSSSTSSAAGNDQSSHTKPRTRRMKLQRTSSSGGGSGVGSIGDDHQHHKHQHQNYHHNGDGTGANSNNARLLVGRSCSSSPRCTNILASRSVPLLFISVCFLVIANTNCDQVGSANEDSNVGSEFSASSLGGSDRDLEIIEQQASSALKSSPMQRKVALLNVLREIYLDHNSKVTVLLPEVDTVQKFHPNGRYGRRSVYNLLEPHAEFGKLILDDQLDASQVSLSRPVSSGSGSGSGSTTSSTSSSGGTLLRAILRGSSRDLSLAKARRNVAGSNELLQSNVAQVADYQVEMSKLLKCSYAGMPNLYWCDTSVHVQAAS